MQGRDDTDLDHGGDHGEKWADLEYILEVELIVPATFLKNWIELCAIDWNGRTDSLRGKIKGSGVYMLNLRYILAGLPSNLSKNMPLWEWKRVIND